MHQFVCSVTTICDLLWMSCVVECDSFSYQIMIKLQKKRQKKKVEYVFLECHIDDFLEFYTF